MREKGEENDLPGARPGPGKRKGSPVKKEKNEEKIKGVRSFPSSLMRLEREGRNCLIGEGKTTCFFPCQKELKCLRHVSDRALLGMLVR